MRCSSLTTPGWWWLPPQGTPSSGWSPTWGTPECMPKTPRATPIGWTRFSHARWTQGQVDQFVRARQAVQLAAGCNEGVELLGGNWNAGHDAVNAAHFFFEIPDELAAGRLAGEAPTILQEDRDTRREQRLIVRRNQPDPVHQPQHVRRIVIGFQQREPTLHHAVCGVVVGTANRRSAHPIG